MLPRVHRLQHWADRIHKYVSKIHCVADRVVSRLREPSQGWLKLVVASPNCHAGVLIEPSRLIPDLLYHLQHERLLRKVSAKIQSVANRVVSRLRKPSQGWLKLVVASPNCHAGVLIEPPGLIFDILFHLQSSHTIAVCNPTRSLQWQ